MKITGIEALKFGVDDRQKAARFLADFGLSRGESDIPGADLFLTLNRSRLYLFDRDDARLPAAFEPGSTLREVVWGSTAPPAWNNWPSAWSASRAWSATPRA
ncbi:hypothetical protein MBH78_00050 [Oceanimonas sp. NS1]|nr:hypothetical protein [Oceanimonas sp. NS1]